MTVHALLLAAGRASRFGADKLLAPLHGEPLIAPVARTLAKAAADGLLAGSVAVVSVDALDLRRTLEKAGLRIVENPDAANGMAGSLQQGLAALATKQPVEGALIVLGDQPALRLDVITAVVKQWKASGGTVRPRYAASPEAPGHPVLLSRRDWHLADRLAGDQGFRDLLAGTPVTLVDVLGDNPDVDTAADLRRLEDRH